LFQDTLEVVANEENPFRWLSAAACGREELTLRTAGTAMGLLAALGAALVFALLAYVSYRDSNVSRIAVSKLSDLEEVFEIGASSLRVRSPEFREVCFTGDYVYALKDARQWFRTDQTEFKRALGAAGGPADAFNDAEHSSIVLLSHSFALILQLDGQEGLLLANFGCASIDAGDIEIRRYQTNFSTEFYLPNATPKSPHDPGQPRATLCEEKMERFVESIDDLLAKQIAKREVYRAVIRKYLPETGCTVEEVISISKTSRFFTPPFDFPPPFEVYLIMFRNSGVEVGFGLKKDNGNTELPYVRSTGPPSW
jgi:hypothetical protein